MRPLIYLGPHTALVSPDFAGRAERHGKPVLVEDGIAEALIARGDFVLFQPEPARRPVQKKTKE